MKNVKRLLAIATALAMIMGLCSFTAFADTGDGSSDETVIVLSDDGITVNGSAVTEDETEAVYIANDIIYYEDLDYYEDTGYEYGEGTDEDKHSEEEAAAHTVVHITEAGTYRISGTLSCGQIFIDLGDDAEEDSTAVVTLILDNVDITCTVAPAVLFYSVYECDTAWVEDEDNYTASATQDTSAAGANVIIADGSVNTVNGSYVAKIYKNNGNAKKLYKFDGAFYSKMSMNVDGEEEGTGVLNIIAENEGLDSELHLTINGGTINIQSQDDGINTNEDNVSVTTINGGSIHILGGLGDEGDGIDSNGYLVINGGVVIAIANPSADSGLDSDCGSYINGGTVLATGSTMDWPESESEQVTMNLQFEEAQDSDEAIIVTDSDGNVVFAYDPDEDETTGSYNRGYQGAVISCAEFEVGETYYVYIGGTVAGEDTNGLYDNSTVTGFSGAMRQIYTGTDVGMDNMPGTGSDSDNMGDMGDMDDSGSTFPGGDSMGDMDDSGSTFPGGDSMGDSGSMGDMGDSGSSQIQPRTVSESASYALAEGTTYSNQFYLTDYVNEFSGVQDDPDYVSDDTDTDDNADDGTDDDTDNDADDNTDDNTGGETDDNGDDGSSSSPDIDENMGVPDDGDTGDDTDDESTDDDADDDTSDDGTSGGTSSGNWEGYLEYLKAYAEENYDSIAAPDSDTTVEELTAAIEELTEDTYSSSILYSVLTELGGALTYEEWLAENGSADDDTSDEGSGDDESSDDSSGEDGNTDDGSDDDSSASPEIPNDESSDDESADDNISDDSSDDSSDDDAGSDDSSDDDISTDSDAGSTDTDTDADITDTDSSDTSAESETEDTDEAENSAGSDEVADEESEEAADEESAEDTSDDDTADEDASDEDTSGDDASDEDTSDEESESESAQTGDHTNMIFWSVLAAVSATALCFLGFRRKFN